MASESETSFAAVPYFAQAASPADPHLSYDWTVNGNSIASDKQNPNDITISAQNAGVAHIALSLSDLTNPFVSSTGSWDVSFGSASSPLNDAFHTPTQ